MKLALTDWRDAADASDALMVPVWKRASIS
jgi:hypothetical protein